MPLKKGDLFSITYYEYGEAFFGSLSGTRFRIAREPLENVHNLPADRRADAVLRAAVWPEPFSFRAVSGSSLTMRDFPFTQEGLDEASEWINQMAEAK